MPASDYQDLLRRHLDAENRHDMADTLATLTAILVAELRDGLMGGERIYWDRATVLEQLGRL